MMPGASSGRGGARPWLTSLGLVVALCALFGAGVAFDLIAPPFAALLVMLFSACAFVATRGRDVPPPIVVEPPREELPIPAPLVDPRVEAVVAALPEPALLLTPGGEILTANQRVALSVGPAKVGDPLSFLVRVPEVLEAVRAGAQDGLPRRVEFGERVPLDRWLEAHVVPLRLNPGGRGTSARDDRSPDTVLLTFRDLTHQRRIEQMRADFVANASHELRTPLASLLGFIETLLGPARNDVAARERFLGIMAAQARRMSRLIEDLLSLSRIELNAHVRPETPVELGGIVAHVCDTLGPLAQDRDVEIEISRPQEPVYVLGERDELIRLFENLVENALKYGANGHRVEVVVGIERSGTPAAVVSVQDFGPGISPEHLPRLTERFYRVDVAVSRDQGGTGLGLAIVKHIVARHRGRMGIESRQDAGATFTVRFDLVEVPEKNLVKSKA
ncbi:ATP-binding protein [Roseixanthobacter pseudopolyaromaticivorans]|uniref:ATP-binding protein n=1 Tax=Xanthobacteraceae TaxID=335928 RepID=UPI00372BF3F9